MGFSGKNFYYKDYRNIVDYIYDFGDCPFDEVPFCDADNVVFSLLSYIEFERFLKANDEFVPITVHEACVDYLSWMRIDFFTNDLSDWLRKTIFLAMALLKNKRFSQCKITDFPVFFSHRKAEQFAGLRIEIADGTYVIAFRGTDTTLTGWEEDFNLACYPYTPGQKRALEFTRNCIRKYPRKKCRIMGHSKGGNFAVFASATLTEKEQKHIINVYSDDAPGCSAELYASEGHQRIKDRIVHIVPMDDIIGSLLHHEEISYVVAAEGFSDFMNQHDAFTWKMEGINFRRVPDTTPMSKYMALSFNDLITKDLTQEDTISLVKIFTRTIKNTGYTSAITIFDSIPSFVLSFYATANKGDKNDKMVLKKAFKKIVSAFRAHFKEYVEFNNRQQGQLQAARKEDEISKAVLLEKNA